MGSVLVLVGKARTSSSPTARRGEKIATRFITRPGRVQTRAGPAFLRYTCGAIEDRTGPWPRRTLCGTTIKATCAAVASQFVRQLYCRTSDGTTQSRPQFPGQRHPSPQIPHQPQQGAQPPSLTGEHLPYGHTVLTSWLHGTHRIATVLTV